MSHNSRHGKQSTRLVEKSNETRDYAEMVYPVSPLHPADYEVIIKNQPKDAQDHSSTLPQVNTIVPETKKSVVQAFVPATAELTQDSFEMNPTNAAALVRKDSKTDYGAKPTDAKKWPGHKIADSLLTKMQNTFGHNEALANGGRTYDTSYEAQLKKVVSDTAKDTVDSFKQIRKDSDAILEALQEKFGHNDTMNDPPAVTSSLTIDQQIRKTAQDTWEDLKDTVHQVGGGGAEEKAKAAARVANDAEKQRALNLDL